MTSTSDPSVSLTMTPREACTLSGRTPSSLSTCSYFGLQRHRKLSARSQLHSHDEAACAYLLRRALDISASFAPSPRIACTFVWPHAAQQLLILQPANAHRALGALEAY